MTAIPKQKMTVDEFLAWAEQQPKEDGSYELIDGVVVERFGPATSQNAQRSQHWKLKAAAFLALYDAVKKARLPCHTAVDGPTVRINESRSFEPDVLVYCGEEVAPDALIVPNPVIIVEVLSPSTSRRDHGIKLQSYFTLPSLAHYLIVDPEGPRIIHHKRGTGDAIETRFIEQRFLRLDPPGLDLDLGEVLGDKD